MPPSSSPDAPTVVAQALEEDIIFGRLAPGSRLVEDPLMARFGVTRHSIRQALLELERAGVVVREKNKGAAVRRLAPEEVEQIYEVREMLVRQAALRVPLPAPAEVLEELVRLHEAFAAHRRAGEWRALHETNDRFHLTLFGACGNPVLVDLIRHAMALSLPVRAGGTTDAARAEASEREHALMIALLQGTDRWALAQLCVDHLQPAKRRYLASRLA